MNGKQIFDTISNNTYNKAVALFTKALADETCSETVAVGCHLILIDTDIIEDCKDADDLRQKVLDQAKAKGSYAGMNYIEENFLDPDDADYEESDSGLDWVTFADLWQALETACNELKN